MKESRFLALCFIAALFASIQSGSGQVINASVQNVASRPALSRAAPVARPIANQAIVPHFVPKPAEVVSRAVTPYAPRTVAQSAPNLLPNYPVVARSSNPGVAAINAQRVPSIGGQETIALDPATRQNELRTLAAMRQQRALGTKNRGLAAMNVQRHITTENPLAIQRRAEPLDQPENIARPKWRQTDGRSSYSDALHRHWHEWHDRNWWHHHCDTIVFVIGGYYFLDGSYWYPAWGYDPLQSYYDYDGPIYTYSNLLPDAVIANVQAALQDAGYYFGAITGSLNFELRTALANFQRDYGLSITGAIDEATVEALGLY